MKNRSFMKDVIEKGKFEFLERAKKMLHEHQVKGMKDDAKKAHDDQIAWQRKVIREEYIEGAEDFVRPAKIYRVRSKKGVHGLGKRQKAAAAKVARTEH